MKGRKNRRKIKKESEWKTYWGSCKELLEDIKRLGEENFERKILKCYKSKWEVSYYEALEQFNRGVLLSDLYYNGIIQCRLRGMKNGIYGSS